MTNHRFSEVPKAEIQRSSFDRSHGLKTAIDGGKLYPIFVDEGLPGDTFNLKMHAIARLATPIFPIMDNVYIDTFFFAVPNRLLWDNWEKFNGSQAAPGDSTDFNLPVVTGSVELNSLSDYMGLPIHGETYMQASALPFRAYYLIWNEWFRDENLQAPLPTYTSDNSTPASGYIIQSRGKRHDYFTSCLPWPQKGEAVTIPLGTSAPVISNFNTATDLGGQPHFEGSDGYGGPNGLLLTVENGGNNAGYQGGSASSTQTMYWGTDTGLMADLSDATAATINTLRQAFQVQKILERDARGGTRYTELIKAHFGVTSPDARLQRPEYLGGYSQPINISQIHQTNETGLTGTPLGQVGAIGTAVLHGGNNGFTTSFTEHVTIIGLVAVRAELTYQQQLNRMWSRQTRFDFYWPALAHIGEQSVLNQEIFFKQDQAIDEAVFGYQERYAEYRYKPSTVTSLMRSIAPQSLDAWHLALDYSTTPGLNSAFITDNPPLDRVVAVPSEPKFILDCWFDLQCARPMPMYGVPGLIDHF